MYSQSQPLWFLGWNVLRIWIGELVVSIRHYRFIQHLEGVRGNGRQVFGLFRLWITFLQVMHSKPQYEVEHTLSTPRYGQYGYEFLLVLFSFRLLWKQPGKTAPSLRDSPGRYGWHSGYACQTASDFLRRFVSPNVGHITPTQTRMHRQ